MIKNVRKTKVNRRGVVLVTAVGVLLLVFILLTAVVGYVSVNRTQTNENYKKEQAYLTASSTVQSFVAQIKQDTAAPSDPTDAIATAKQKKAIQDLQNLAAANGGKGTTINVTYNGTDGSGDRLGTTTLTIMQDGTSDTNLIVLAKTTYAGHTEQVAAHISTLSKRKPKDLTNCIELLGSEDHEWDNLNVVGDMASLNNSSSIKYSFRNDTNVYGSYTMYGKWYPGSANPNIVLKAALYDSSTGSSMTVSEGIYDWLWLSTTMIKQQTNYDNYINTDGTVQFNSTAKQSKIGGTGGFDIDIYCCNAEIGANGMVQYGNFYCYKGADANTAGNAHFFGNNPSDVTINGNLYVEGDLKVDKPMKVTGEVICGGTITGKANIQGATSITEHGSMPNNTLRDTKPEISERMDEYIYYPEDFFMSTDTTLTPISSTYNAFYNGGITKTIKDFEDAGLYDGAYFKYHVTESCKWADNFDFNTNGNGLLKVLIEVNDTTKDVVIQLPEGGLSWGAKWRPLFVVRNRSSWETTYDEDGVTPLSVDRKYNCYFVSASGDSITLNGTDPVTGKSLHAGATSVKYNFETMRVLDFDTYVNMFDSSVLTSQSWNGNETPKAGFVFNPSDVDSVTAKMGGADYSSYKPDHADIFFLLAKDAEFHCTNDSMFQACWYAPEGIVDIATNGMNGLNCTDSNGSTASTVNLNVCNIGVVTASNFGNANKAYYVFTKPSATSLMAAAKGGKDLAANGFALDRYDHK